MINALIYSLVCADLVKKFISHCWLNFTQSMVIGFQTWPEKHIVYLSHCTTIDKPAFLKGSNVNSPDFSVYDDSLHHVFVDVHVCCRVWYTLLSQSNFPCLGCWLILLDSWCFALHLLSGFHLPTLARSS